MPIRQMLLVLAAALAAPIAVAQASRSSAPLVFDAATIKPSPPDNAISRHTGGPGTGSPTLYRRTHGSVSDLIRVGWNVRGDMIFSTFPIARDEFDVVARLPEGATKDGLSEMMRNLLADRFGLKTHMETREFSVYEMVVGKSGLKVKEDTTESIPPTDSTSASANDKADWRKLKPGKPGFLGSYSVSGGMRLVRQQFQLDTFASIAPLLETSMTQLDQLPIVDHTGLTGNYTFSLEYSEDLPGVTPDGPPLAPNLFDVLRSQIGVELIKRKLPFSVVVVDAVNRTPTDN